MAKSTSASEGEIREGFLCPICLYDLKTVDQLQEHFEVTHSTEDHDVFQALKGFLDKAKRKILKQDTWNEELTKVSFESEVPNISYNSVPCLMQELGSTSNHTQYFKKLRDKKINRYVLETNKLLIRLDKLICDIADDPEKRKEFEKSIVPWVPDSDVPLCPGCAKSFGLSRRRHHCRLCGGVMCHACSFFISYDFARKLTLPMVSDDQRLLQKPSAVSRRSSSASLMSVVSMNSNEQSIRVCKDCHVLLQRHDKIVEQKSHKPVILQMYERLKRSMDEIEKIVPLYLEMLESLNSGETDYQLQDAQELNVKISKLAERIDANSKRILNLEVGTEESNRSIQLQSGIRMAASQFLRNVVLGLPSPPSPEEISQYQSQRQVQVQRRIQLEKQAEMQQSKKETHKNTSPSAGPKPQTHPVSPDTGWCVVSSDKVKDDEDPMLQQINIIHKYIKQARMDHKYDEVRMLENNLKELQQEFTKQRKLS